MNVLRRSALDQVGRMLLPGQLVAAARRGPVADYKRRTGCRAVLLLRVPDHERELAWGLDQVYGATPEALREPPKVLDFHTAIVGSAGVSMPTGPARGAASTGTTNFGPDDLLTWIVAARCFAIPIAQREDAIGARISLGRARNKDLSLRSQNISKLHAWFEYDAKGTLLVADAGSKNGTKVRGVRLEPRQPVPVASGTVLHFGALEAMVCTIEEFWEIASVV